MKKAFFDCKYAALFLVLTILACPFALTSCSYGSLSNSNVVGTWVGDDYDKFYSNVTITFNSDGTGTATIDHVGVYTSIRRGQFTYKVKGNTVTTEGTLASANSDGETSSQTFNNTYELNENQLILRSGNAWYTNVVHSYRKQ